MKTINFGLVGTGLMAKEFASVVSRWDDLLDVTARPQIVAVCSRDPKGAAAQWFAGRLPTVKQLTADLGEMLANADVEAVYCAVPHDLHAEQYTAIIKSGRHLMGEKPFGIDLEANRRILDAIVKTPAPVVRCSSEFPFHPAVQKIAKMIEGDAFGRIIEVNSFFRHSSDLDPEKAINWKRTVERNGEYGCMGDLGMHVCHVPFRAGWIPKNVRAILSKIYDTRPDGKGGRVKYHTWDNATLLCETADRRSGASFPMTIKMQRIAPGERNSWSLEILGTKGGARFSTKNPKLLQTMAYRGGSDQSWQQADIGHEGVFKTITGGIFEFGFGDCFLQMWAAYLEELATGKPRSLFAGCVTPEETALSHRLFTAAIESQKRAQVISV